MNDKELLISETSAGTTPINGGFHYFDEIDDSPGSAGNRQILSMSGVYVASSNLTLYVNITSKTSGTAQEVALNLTYTRIG